MDRQRRALAALFAEARTIVGPRGNPSVLVLSRLRRMRAEDADARTAAAAVLPCLASRLVDGVPAPADGRG
jgi:hypothetical protein